jgi:hypothetical protein
MMTGYDHLLFLAGVIFFLYRLNHIACDGSRHPPFCATEKRGAKPSIDSRNRMPKTGSIAFRWFSPYGARDLICQCARNGTRLLDGEEMRRRIQNHKARIRDLRS